MPDTSKQPDSVVVGNMAPSRIKRFFNLLKTKTAKQKKTYLIFGVLAVCIVLVVAGAITVSIYYVSAENRCNSNGAKSLYQEAAAALQAGSQPELDKLISSIKKDPNYRKDPNCLYPVALYHLKNKQFTEAEAVAADIKNVQEGSEAFDTAYEKITAIKAPRTLNLLNSEIRWQMLEPKDGSKGNTIMIDSTP